MITLADALANGTGIERQFLCPVHADTHPSASVNTVKMVWVCYACGAHGKVGGADLLTEIDSEAFRRRIKRQAEHGGPLPESWLNVYDGDHPYWLSRFTAAACARFRLGYDYQDDTATIPLRTPSGELVGVIRRALAGDGPRYLYPRGADVSQYLWNRHAVDAAVLVLTEGATDAVAAWEAGFDAVAILGSALRAPQARLLRRYDPEGIVCAFDMDQGGRGAYSSVLAEMREYRVSRATWSPREGKDLASLDVKRREEILSKAIARYGSVGLASSA